MEIRTEETTHGDGHLALDGEAGRQRALDALWYTGAVLWRRRRFIVGFTTTVALVSIVIALLTPKWFAAEARLLQPEGGGLSGMLGIVNRATGGLGSLLGGGGGYERYLALLTSRTMMEDVIERFDLMEVYDIDVEEGAEREAKFAALEKLSGNVDFAVELEYDYLAVVAFDKDPERAAEMANYMVERLNEENARLSSEAARATRQVIERRLNRATADLDSVRNALQEFQETNGLIELEAQAGAMMQSVAELRGEAAKLEVQYQTLARQYGPNNPQVLAAQQARNAAQAQIDDVLGGRDQLLPVSMRDLPALTSRYAQLLQEQLIQRQILETVYPIYEQALFQEQSEAQAVQVIDYAVAPVRAARPSRRLIVIGATLTALLLASLFVLGQAWLRRHSDALASRFRQAAQMS